MNGTNSTNFTSTDTTTGRIASSELAVDVAILIVGVVGNSLVLLILKRHKTTVRRAPFQYFIANLSIVDFMSPVVYMMYRYVETMSLFFCKVFYPILSILQVVSMYTVVAIAIFRCKAIVNPFHFKPGKKSIYGTIAGIWVLSHVMFIPLYIVLQFSEKTGYCNEFWPSRTLNKAYTVALFVVQYPIPLAIMTICYIKIVLHLKHHKISQENNFQIIKKRQHDKEVIKISVAIVLLFCILTLPLQIAWLSLVVFDNPTIAAHIYNFAFQITLLHSCCNPIVYGTISQQFRARIKTSLRSICCRLNRKTHTVASGSDSKRDRNKTVELTMVTRRKEAHSNDAMESIPD